MRIGIDATTWWNRRGFGRFTRQLVTAMIATPRGHRLVLFVDRPPDAAMLAPDVEIVRIATGATVTESAVADGSRRIADVLACRRAVARTPLDIMYFPAVYSWFPVPRRLRSVVTFHDAIAEHHAALVFPGRVGRLFWTAKTALAKWSASGFTTVSNAAKAEIVTYLRIPPERIDVVLEAADPIFRPSDDTPAHAALRARLGVPLTARLLVYVGGLAPHKNLRRLIDAFAAAVAVPAVADLCLVFVGDPGGDGFLSNYAELTARVDGDAALRGRVVFTGFVSDADLVLVYSDAFVVAMPALSEGFGLPAAEALACGTPVIATAGGAVAEVVGAAGRFFDPLDVAAIAATIVDVASDADLYARLRAACAPRAAELSWSAAAAATLGILERHAERR